MRSGASGQNLTRPIGHPPLPGEGIGEPGGFGKDMSFYALEDYTQIKHVMHDLTDTPVKPWYFIARGE